MATKKAIDPTTLTSVESAQAAGVPYFRFTTDGRRPELEKTLGEAALAAYLDDIRIRALPDKGDGKLRVRLVASTNMRDLAGDTFTQKALGEMESQAVGTTMFLNHKRQVPEDVFGSVEKAELVVRTVNDLHGEPVKVAALEYTVVVAKSNPRAMQTYEQIADGTARLGASVTVAVLDKQPQSKGVGDIINGIYYLECSVVGIPMNPGSFVEYASKCLDLDPEVSTEAAPTASTNDATAPGAAATAPPSVVVAAPEGGRVTSVTLRSALADEVEPGTTPATIVVKGKALEMGIAHLKAAGLFNDELAKRRPTFYELYDVFTSIIYRLFRLRMANRSAGVEDTFDYKAALKDISEELALALFESALSYFGIDADGQEVAPAEVSSYSLELIENLSILVKEQAAEPDANAEMWLAVRDLADAHIPAGMKSKAAPAADVAGAATNNTQPSTEMVAKSLLDEANLETKTWKAIADTALSQLETLADRPLPRAGM